MQILLEIPKNFEIDYQTDKFQDFFKRALVDMHSLCSNHEKEIAEMLSEAFLNGTIVRKESVLTEKRTELSPEKKEPSLFGISKGIICQQVNCCGVMGAGLAKAIMDQYPQVKEAFDDCYNNTTNENNKAYKCHYNQLGTFQYIPLDKPFKSINERMRDPHYLRDSKLMVANIYSQDFYGNPAKTGKIYTKLDLLIDSIKTLLSTSDLPVYIPHTKEADGKDYGIGCGYGGEVWERVYPALQKLAQSYDNLYLLDTKTCQIEKVEPEKQEELEMEKE